MKQTRIAISYGSGIGKDSISAAADFLRAAIKKYKLNIRLLPIDADNGDISERGEALALSCDAVLWGVQWSDEAERRLAATLGARFCVMPVTSVPVLGRVSTPQGEVIRPSVRISFISMRSFYGRYSKESADKSTIFETEAINKEDYAAAVAYAADLARKEHSYLSLTDIGDNAFYTDTAKRMSGTEASETTAEQFAQKLIKNPQSTVVVARDDTCAVLHSVAMELLSHRALCYKKYIGGVPLYMPQAVQDKQLMESGRECPAGAMLAAADILDTLGYGGCADKMRKSIFTLLGHGYSTKKMDDTNGISTADFAAMVIGELLK